MRNTTLDDISAEIGFTATISLARQRGAKNVYVPANPAGSVLAELLGVEAAERLAACWGGELLAVPTLRACEYARDRCLIARLTEAGLSVADIAECVGLTARRVVQVRHELRDAGLLKAGRARSAAARGVKDAPQAQPCPVAGPQRQRDGDGVP